MRIVVVLIAACLLLGAIAADGAPRRLTLRGIRADFNATSDRARVLAIMSPG